VTGLVAPTGFVAGLRFEQTVLEVRETGAVDALGEEPLKVTGRGDIADHRPETLDGADARQRRDDRAAHTLRQEVLRLRDVGVRRRPGRERRVDDVGTERLAVRVLPGRGRGNPELRAR